MDPIVARKTWRTVEPVHALIYFAPEAKTAYANLGLDPVAGYFASRSAAMGAVGSEVVVATFFNFNPQVVRTAVPRCWDRASPGEVLSSRTAAAGAALERALGHMACGTDMDEAAELARSAALSAGDHPEGRALFAAHAGLDWPSEPLLVLWHAQLLLREFRGDGHVALLTSAGLSGLEALVLHAATGEVDRGSLQRTRGWTDRAWNAAVERLTERGLVSSGGGLSPAGEALRSDIEAQTDELALEPYRALGEDGCTRLRELVRPWSRALVDAIPPS